MMTLDSFKSARSVLAGVINETNLIYSPAFSASCGNNVYLKPENMQITGAYKIRGAYFKISTLTEEEKALGLITASAGNHAPVSYTHLDVYKRQVREVLFQVASIITTTGYATTDFDLWPSFSKGILLFLMVLGACAGSTGGGIKVSRLLIYIKSAVQELRELTKPRVVRTVRMLSLIHI